MFCTKPVSLVKDESSSFKIKIQIIPSTSSWPPIYIEYPRSMDSICSPEEQSVVFRRHSRLFLKFVYVCYDDTAVTFIES